MFYLPEGKGDKIICFAFGGGASNSVKGGKTSLFNTPQNDVEVELLIGNLKYKIS